MSVRASLLGVGLIASGMALVGLGPAGSADKSIHPTVVYIVRHAEKTGESADADLSSEGRVRAQVLNWMMRDIDLHAIYSTDVPRTMSTVAPVAKAKQLSISHYEPSSGGLTTAIREKLVGKRILVCGHSNTIPALLHDFGIGIEDEILQSFDDLFVVILTGDAGDKRAKATLQRLHYPGRR